MLKNNILKLDSALCINPHVKLQVGIKEKKERSGVMKNLPANKDSVDLIFKKLLGDIDIGYLAVKMRALILIQKKTIKYLPVLLIKLILA